MTSFSHCDKLVHSVLLTDSMSKDAVDTASACMLAAVTYSSLRLLTLVIPKHIVLTSTVKYSGGMINIIEQVIRLDVIHTYICHTCAHCVSCASRFTCRSQSLYAPCTEDAHADARSERALTHTLTPTHLALFR